MTRARSRAPVTLGLDLGTSGSGLKAVSLDAVGRMVAEAGATYELLTPRPGWTEQQPADWVNAAREVLRPAHDMQLAANTGPSERRFIQPLRPAPLSRKLPPVIPPPTTPLPPGATT